jgi:hypothetical protein
MRTTLAGSATAAALALGLTVGVAAPVAAATDHRPERKAAGWIGRQLDHGVIRYATSFGPFSDQGSTIDAALGLRAVGGHAATVRAMRAGVARTIQAYVSDGSGGVYAGPVAKAAVLAQATGGGATSFGGTNLIGLLRGRVTPAGPSAGRISDKSSFGDFANVLGQAYAARALTSAHAPEAARATGFLLAQQCSAGFFRTYFAPDAAATAQSCDSGRGKGLSAPDPDATATAVLMLWPQHRTAKVHAALDKARRWLLAHQHRDGSFGGGSGTTAANANSTGLAGQALARLGAPRAAARAAIWVRSVQAHEVRGCSNGLSRQNGAIAYDRASLRDGLAHGIASTGKTPWVKATAQALGVLAHAPRATGRLRLAHTAHRHAGVVRVVVRGVAPGDAVCVTGRGKHVRAVAGPLGVARAKVRFAAAVHRVRLAVRDSGGRHTRAVVRIHR